jgi:hypothetical protein
MTRRRIQKMAYLCQNSCKTSDDSRVTTLQSSHGCHIGVLCRTRMLQILFQAMCQDCFFGILKSSIGRDAYDPYTGFHVRIPERLAQFSLFFQFTFQSHRGWVTSVVYLSLYLSFTSNREHSRFQTFLYAAQVTDVSELILIVISFCNISEVVISVQGPVMFPVIFSFRQIWESKFCVNFTKLILS